MFFQEEEDDAVLKPNPKHSSGGKVITNISNFDKYQTECSINELIHRGVHVGRDI